MSIEYFQPFSIFKKIGSAYNTSMNRLRDDEYGVFTDADTIFTTPDYGNCIAANILRYPKVRCFTAMTNRVGCTYQIPDDVDVVTNDYMYHRNYGIARQKEFYYKVQNVAKLNYPFSGFFMIFRKDLWNEIGGAREDGMLGTDTNLYRKVVKNGDKILMLKGVFLYHFYRNNDVFDKSHLS